jgi:hypothetical protein
VGYAKPTSYEIWTAAPASDVLRAAEEAFGRRKWKVKRERPVNHPDGSIVYSIIARQRDLQSLQVEVVDPGDGSPTLAVVHPRFLHGFRLLPGLPVYALQGAVKKKVEEIVEGIERLHPQCGVRPFHYEGEKCEPFRK